MSPVTVLSVLKMAALVAGAGGLSGRPGADRDAEWLILRTGEGERC